MNWNENKKLGKWKKLSIFPVLRSRSRHFKNGPGADFLLVESRERRSRLFTAAPAALFKSTKRDILVYWAGADPIWSEPESAPGPWT